MPFLSPIEDWVVGAITDQWSFARDTAVTEWERERNAQPELYEPTREIALLWVADRKALAGRDRLAALYTVVFGYAVALLWLAPLRRTRQRSSAFD